MRTLEATSALSVKNILYLTDFSLASESAMKFAMALARENAATVHVLHVQIPEFYTYSTPESAAAMLQVQDELAAKARQQVDLDLAGIRHDITIMRNVGVWPAVEQVMEDVHPDLIVLGTRGRTGASKLILGSVAEDILRRSPAPVLTIGPCVPGDKRAGEHFHCILFPTDFSSDSLAAAPCATSLAVQNHARLVLYHVLRGVGDDGPSGSIRAKMQQATHELEGIVAKDTTGCQREVLVGSGDPADQILQVARENGADLIVLGVRDLSGHTGAAIHLGRAVAHKVIANAACPVLTVRA